MISTIVPSKPSSVLSNKEHALILFNLVFMNLLKFSSVLELLPTILALKHSSLEGEERRILLTSKKGWKRYKRLIQLRRRKSTKSVNLEYQSLKKKQLEAWNKKWSPSKQRSRKISQIPSPYLAASQKSMHLIFWRFIA